MPLILDRDSRVWFGEHPPALGAITAYSFDSAEVEGAEPSVQVALVGWWMLADGGHVVQPGFWTFTGEDCESVVAWCEKIQKDLDWGQFGLMALADLLWVHQTDEAKEAFTPPIPLDLPATPDESAPQACNQLVPCEQCPEPFQCRMQMCSQPDDECPACKTKTICHDGGTPWCTGCGVVRSAYEGNHPRSKENVLR